MEPSPMPWRTIDAASSVAASAGAPMATDPAPSPMPPVVGRTTMAVVAATVLVAIAAFLLAFGGGPGGDIVVGGGAALGESRPTGAPGESAGQVDLGQEIVVEVVGAVVKPGVYHLASGSRVADLLDAAGGYGPRVDTDQAARRLNRASVLKDGDQIRVPSRDDVTASAPGADGPGSGPSGAAAGRLDLNRATSAELEALPGIGPVTASKIIAARDESPFVTVDDLRTRKLLGQKTFDGLKDLVAVH